MNKSHFITAAVLTTLFMTATAESSWKLLPGITVSDLMTKCIYDRADRHLYEDCMAEVASTGGLSWPDGRQAVVTYIHATYEATAENDTLFIYRCIEYFNTYMKPTGEACYAPDSTMKKK